MSAIRHAGALVAAILIVVAATSPSRAQNPTDLPNPTPIKLAMTTQWVGPDNHFVTAIAEDSTGWWWGTDDHGLWHYSPSAKPGKQWNHIRSVDGLYDDAITALCIDNDGRLWVGTERRGVSVWNGSWWRNFDPMTGPLGVHISCLAVNPADGAIWMGSEGGIAIYSDRTRTWRYITAAEGLASNKVTSIAFSAGGAAAIVGTADDGLMIAQRSPAAAKSDATIPYSAWTQVKAEDDPSVAETGAGLPGNQINCLLTNKAGKIFCGTATGMASSTDGGATWTYLRGWSWQEKLQRYGLRKGRMRWNDDKLPLVDDFVSCLAFDKGGHLYIGHRQRGIEVIDGSTGEQLSHSRFDAYGVDIKAIAPLSTGGVLIGNYGSGVSLATWDGITSEAEIAPAHLAKSTPMPDVAAPPSASELKAIGEHLAGAPADWSKPGAGAFAGEDWQTQGTWFDRYGKQYSVLCGCVWSGDVIPTSEAGYAVTPQLGNSQHPGETFSRWLQWLESDDPRVLFDPEIGQGRQAEWDDHGERYPQSFDGPDLWLTVSVPAGKHRVSLYFMNKDGHKGITRYRDFIVQLRTYSDANTIAQAYYTPNLFPVLAQTRVSNFWPGVYESFNVSGPSKYYVRIGKNYSINTILQGVFIDRLSGADAKPVEDKREADHLWSLLGARAENGDLQRESRVLAIGAATAANEPAAMLKQWRSELGLWSDDDWAVARKNAAAMKAAAVKAAAATKSKT